MICNICYFVSKIPDECLSHITARNFHIFNSHLAMYSMFYRFQLQRKRKIVCSFSGLQSTNTYSNHNNCQEHVQLKTVKMLLMKSDGRYINEKIEKERFSDMWGKGTCYISAVCLHFLYFRSIIILIKFLKLQDRYIVEYRDDH